MNTFEAPPRTLRVADLPPPFAPSLPAMPKRASVASVAAVAPVVPIVQQIPAASRRAATEVEPASTVIGAAPTRRRFDRERFTRRVALLLVAMLVAGGGVYAYRTFIDTGPPHPDSWDTRVVQIAKFVERERELTFDHPIFVDFLPVAAYQAAAGGASGTGTSSADAAQAATDASDLLDAFGLARGTAAGTANSTISSVATLGFYSPVTDRITIRGTELTPAVRVVLAHELTHALQAQHFDLVDRQNDPVLRAIAEADAMRIERRYELGMMPDDRAAADAANSMNPKVALDLAKVPWPVLEMRYAPYALGPALVSTVFDVRGNDGVNLLLHTPPSEAQLLSPWKWSPGLDATPAEVAAVAPPGAAVAEASQPLPTLQLLVMLDAWLPWSMARGALDSLQGAAYVPYRATPTGPLCVSVTAQFTGGTERFAEALAWWAGAAGSTAQPIVNGDTVSFDACPRGKKAAVPPKPEVGTNTELLIENAAISGTVRDERSATVPLCVVRQLIDTPGIAPLLASAKRSPAEQSIIVAASATARRTCGG